MLFPLCTSRHILLAHAYTRSNVAPASAGASRAGSRLHSASSQGRKEEKGRPEKPIKGPVPTKKRKCSQTSQTLYEDLHYKDGSGLKLKGSGMGAINPIMVEDEGVCAGACVCVYSHCMYMCVMMYTCTYVTCSCGMCSKCIKYNFMCV